jgi:L-asparaginase II
MPSVPLVRVIRSGLEESAHHGDVCVVGADGATVAQAGDASRVIFARSCMKPLQATVSLSLAPFEFTDREIAVMCASHNAEPIHLEVVRTILDRAGVPEAALQCPPRRPMDEVAAAAAGEPKPIHSDCSGKHAGMLAACVAQGWPLETYLEPDHPFQQAVLRAVKLATGLDDTRVGVDGCGAPVHGMPLSGMATIYAKLAAGDLEDLSEHARRAAAAMIAQPYMVAGRNRVDTAIIEATGSVVVKAGAEGLLCAGTPALGGVAVKIRDGSSRGTGPALIHVLHAMGHLDDQQVTRLAEHARPPVLGGGLPVGELVAEFNLGP